MARIPKKASTIEEFILAQFGEDESVEITRAELSRLFNCAPSQISYVVHTRFCPDRGYMVTSVKGGGGYIRITRAAVDKREYLLSLVNERIGDWISRREAVDILHSLARMEHLDEGVVSIMTAAMADLTDDPDVSGMLRARLLKNMLIAAMRQGG